MSKTTAVKLKLMMEAEAALAELEEAPAAPADPEAPAEADPDAPAAPDPPAAAAATSSPRTPRLAVPTVV